MATFTKVKIVIVQPSVWLYYWLLKKIKTHKLSILLLLLFEINLHLMLHFFHFNTYKPVPQSWVKYMSLWTNRNPPPTDDHHRQGIVIYMCKRHIGAIEPETSGKSLILPVTSVSSNNTLYTSITISFLFIWMYYKVTDDLIYNICVSSVLLQVLRVLLTNIQRNKTKRYIKTKIIWKPKRHQ